MKLLQIHEPGQTPAPHQDELLGGDGPASNDITAGIAVGIDLGTTHSLVAVALGREGDDGVGEGMAGRVVVVPPLPGVTGNEGPLLPSVVTYHEDSSSPVVGCLEGGEESLPFVGEGEALLSSKDTSGTQAPAITLRSIKRLMGRSYQDALKQNMGRFPLLEPDDTGDTEQVMLNIHGRRVSPQEVSAMILAKLKLAAEAFLETPVTQAVITVPAYFEEAARQATRHAAEIAGIKVLRLLNEPTAAAVAYGLDEGLRGLYLVYDFGGGTFDASLLQLEKGVFRVLATTGDTHLGGDDIDAAIVDHWSKQKELELKSHDVSQVEEWLQRAKGAKEALSFQDAFAAEGVSLSLETLQTIAQPIVDRTLELVHRLLQDSATQVEDLAGIILVGGSCKMPYVRQRVGKLFPGETGMSTSKVLCSLDPETVVAVGAAKQAQALSVGGEHVLMDVTPLSLGLETMGGIVEKIIERNTPIPCQKAQDFTTYQDGQTAIKFHIVQGEREHVDCCRSLATFVLKGLPPKVAGAVRVRTTFTLDPDGLLTVAAETLTKDIPSARCEVQVKPSFGLSDQDMIRLIQEGYLNAVDDMEQRLLTEQKVEAEGTLAALSKALEREGHLLTKGEAADLHQAMEDLKKFIAAEDKEAIRLGLEKLDKTAQSFAQKRIDAAMTKALAGKAITSLI